MLQMEKKCWPLNKMIAVMFANSSETGLLSGNDGHWPSETSHKQLVGHDHPRTKQWCCWAV